MAQQKYTFSFSKSETTSATATIEVWGDSYHEAEEQANHMEQTEELPWVEDDSTTPYLSGPDIMEIDDQDVQLDNNFIPILLDITGERVNQDGTPFDQSRFYCD